MEALLLPIPLTDRDFDGVALYLLHRRAQTWLPLDLKTAAIRTLLTILGGSMLKCWFLSQLGCLSLRWNENWNKGLRIDDLKVGDREIGGGSGQNCSRSRTPSDRWNIILHWTSISVHVFHTLISSAI
jgi:hypothetical protein